LPPPQAVFIGGGANAPGLIEGAQRALSRGGRLVVNAVTLATESLLLACHSQSGGSLTRVAIARAGAIGREAAHMTGWRPARPIVQWTWVKP
jgi:precorrin-6Y C5,15-methyltransferase (decarboxylating)